MGTARFITHPDVVVDPKLPIPRWPLSVRGRARMRAGLRLPWMAGMEAVFSSDEQKALDGAAILSEALDVPHRVLPGLGENDRSATGFLPPDEFWQVVGAYFARPEESVRGWERAIDAQARVVAAVDEGLASVPGAGSVAFVSHGGVGALLLCQLRGVAISRECEQPVPGPDAPVGAGGGYYFAFDRVSRALLHGWEPLDAIPSEVA